MKQRSSSAFSVALLLIALITSPEETLALDPPHNPNDAIWPITCSRCHYSPSTPPAWLSQPTTTDNTLKNNLCTDCHSAGKLTTSVYEDIKTHSAAITGSSYWGGSWTIECVVCHNPHAQEQNAFSASAPDLNIRTGTVTGLASDPSATLSSLGDSSAVMVPDQFLGYLLIPNTAASHRMYRIVSNTTSTFTVSGAINLNYTAVGRQYAVRYGKLVNAQVESPNSGVRNVAFFNSTGPGSFATADASTTSVCMVCHTRTTSFRNDGTLEGPGHPSAKAGTDCMICHSHALGFRPSCDSCHECPPQSGSHVIHFGTASLYSAGYGDTRASQDLFGTASSYAMNCGNCHPLDVSRHDNGTVEVELYSAFSPSGSLKSLNPPSAAYTAGGTVFTDSRGFPYTRGTCRNIYCHSYNDWTTPGGVPESTDCASYIPANLVTTRQYRMPTWGSGPLTCSGCHGIAPRTDYPANDGGAGDSHFWVDGYGYGNLHNWNMGYAPISCSYCHNSTVQAQNTWTRDAMDVATQSDVPIDNYAKHVNGAVDVAFDTVNNFPYSTPYSLAAATYNASTRTCSTVSCHQGQTSVTWGTPYRYYYQIECDRCHNFRGVCP